jgi:hypothetical protein
VTAKKKAATVRPAAGRPGVKAKASAKAAKVPSPKRRTAGAGAAVAAPKSERAEAEVSIDRRRGPRRCDEGAPAPAAATAHVLEKRKKVNRRRQIDPTTCERDYSVDEVEFMNALDDYKRKSGRMFPTCSEVLEVVRGLGYVKISPAGQAALHAVDAQERAEAGETTTPDDGPEALDALAATR